MNIESDLREFIAGELKWDRPADELTPDYPLLDKEVVDSLGIFKIISFVESEYDIEIDDEELVPENFETLEAIVKLVGAKVG